MTTTAAPRLHSSLEWLNADAQTIEAHHGRVLALVFWNASSAYCHNLLDQVASLKARYPLALAALGVHLPKFDAEVDGRTVLKALNRLRVNFPVANDRGWVTWQHYGVVRWPAVALIDPLGNLREIFSGDDQMQALDAAISALVDEVGGIHALPPDHDGLRNAEPRLALSFPSGLLATDGHLYVADSGHHRILECSFEGRVLRQFGTGHAALQDGPATEAAFSQPRGLCILRDWLYVADAGNHAIRRIQLLDGTVETVLGTGRPGPAKEGQHAQSNHCTLNQPWALAGGNDRLYIAVAGSNQVWEFDLGHRYLRFVAGTGELGIADGPGRNALLAHPAGLALVQQTLYVADSASSSVRVIQLQQATVQTVVGQGLYEFGDADGSRSAAQLQYPLALALDPSAPVLWIADAYNGSLRKLRLGGGDVTTHVLPDTVAQPSALAMGGGALWIADAVAHEVLRHDLNTGVLARVPIGE
jgi:sugar lactone lactonase YvrE